MLATLVGLGVAVGCTSGGSGDDAAEPMATTTEPPIGPCEVTPIALAETLPEGLDPEAPPTIPDGIDTGYTGSGEGSGNPYLVPGARQVPGPSMTVTTLGPEPVTAAVAVVPNPDVGSPAAIPAGATTVPPSPTTLPPTATTTEAGTDETTTTGLMSLDADPGCVAVPGFP